MPYCTLQDIKDRFSERELIQLTDEENTGQIDGNVVDRAIGAAGTKIDSYLSARFGAPINPVTDTLREIAVQLSIYYLYLYARNVDKESPEYMIYKDQIAFIKDVRDGKATIGINEQGAKPVSKNTATMTSGGSVFNREDSSVY